MEVIKEQIVNAFQNISDPDQVQNATEFITNFAENNYFLFMNFCFELIQSNPSLNLSIKSSLMMSRFIINRISSNKILDQLISQEPNFSIFLEQFLNLEFSETTSFDVLKILAHPCSHILSLSQPLFQRFLDIVNQILIEKNHKLSVGPLLILHELFQKQLIIFPFHIFQIQTLFEFSVLCLENFHQQGLGNYPFYSNRIHHIIETFGFIFVNNLSQQDPKDFPFDDFMQKSLPDLFAINDLALFKLLCFLLLQMFKHRCIFNQKIPDYILQFSENILTCSSEFVFSYLDFWNGVLQFLIADSSKNIRKSMSDYLFSSFFHNVLNNIFINQKFLVPEDLDCDGTCEEAEQIYILLKNLRVAYKMKFYDYSKQILSLSVEFNNQNLVLLLLLFRALFTKKENINKQRIFFEELSINEKITKLFLHCITNKPNDYCSIQAFHVMSKMVSVFGEFFFEMINTEIDIFNYSRNILQNLNPNNTINVTFLKQNLRFLLNILKVYQDNLFLIEINENCEEESQNEEENLHEILLNKANGFIEFVFDFCNSFIQNVTTEHLDLFISIPTVIHAIAKLIPKIPLQHFEFIDSLYSCFWMNPNNIIKLQDDDMFIDLIKSICVFIKTDLKIRYERNMLTSEKINYCIQFLLFFMSDERIRYINEMLKCMYKCLTYSFTKAQSLIVLENIEIIQEMIISGFEKDISMDSKSNLINIVGVLVQFPNYIQQNWPFISELLNYIINKIFEVNHIIYPSFIITFSLIAKYVFIYQIEVIDEIKILCANLMLELLKVEENFKIEEKFQNSENNLFFFYDPIIYFHQILSKFYLNVYHEDELMHLYQLLKSFFDSVLKYRNVSTFWQDVSELFYNYYDFCRNDLKNTLNYLRKFFFLK